MPAGWKLSDGSGAATSTRLLGAAGAFRENTATDHGQNAVACLVEELSGASFEPM